MENLVIMEKNFWKDKKVFITGHTGFKGAWLSIWLDMLGAKIKGFALNPNTQPNLFELIQQDNDINIISEIGDVRNQSTVENSILEFNPDLLIHMAAQPLVRYSYDNPVETFETNIIGTANILEAAKKCKSIKSIINVTTDKCYDNKEINYAYKEDDRMGGYDPYSASKGCSELVTSSYRNSFMNELEIGLASARAGNVIGGGDWSEDRLIPDIFNAIKNNFPLIIRNPNAIRPWQHVLEPLSGYLKLAESLYKEPMAYNHAWNFGPEEKDSKSVEWVANKINASCPEFSWSIDNKSNPHEANHLKLNIKKAKENLNWKPIWPLEKAIEKVIDWHKEFNSEKNILSLCRSQIEEYTEDKLCS